MMSQAAPTSQRFRPISFLLDDAGALSAPVTLAIRPEDLTRSEPSRSAVHQTLGRDTIGWVDNFGAGLPTCVISGHTGWRTSSASGMDGAQMFDLLNTMVMHDFPKAKQDAINNGIDPGSVKLLFVDTLDNFAWSVMPGPFVLRRSKSRPLLYQYNITLQAISTKIDTVEVAMPDLGNPSNGLFALGNSIDVMHSNLGNLGKWTAASIGEPASVLSGVAAAVVKFTGAAISVFETVKSGIDAAKAGVTGVVNRMIDIAKKFASMGLAIFRTLSSIRNIEQFLKARMIEMAAAFQQVLCIFANSLRSRKVYEQYVGLYGASNCSSTTGGSAPSVYAGKNVFELMQPSADPITLGSRALASIQSVSASDVVLSPMGVDRLGQHAGIVAAGVVL